jgi:hypothetical protein
MGRISQVTEATALVPNLQRATVFGSASTKTNILHLLQLTWYWNFHHFFHALAGHSKLQSRWMKKKLMPIFLCTCLKRWQIRKKIKCCHVKSEIVLKMRRLLRSLQCIHRLLDQQMVEVLKHCISVGCLYSNVNDTPIQEYIITDTNKPAPASLTYMSKWIKLRFRQPGLG